MTKSAVAAFKKYHIHPEGLTLLNRILCSSKLLPTYGRYYYMVQRYGKKSKIREYNWSMLDVDSERATNNKVDRSGFKQASVANG